MAPPGVMLFVGDSTMQHQYKAAKNMTLFANQKIHMIETAGSVNQGKRIAQRMFPSNCFSLTQWEEKRQRERLSASTRVSVAYTNFASLHFLHLHPPRPWWYLPSSECRAPFANSSLQNAKLASEYSGAYGNWTEGQRGWVADYAALLRFEDLVHAELAAHRRLAAQVVVMTPNWICDQRYTGDYKLWVRERYHEGISLCAAYITDRQAHSGWPTLPAGRHSPRNWCRDGQLSAIGSLALERRLKTVVDAAAAKLNMTVSYVEATRMTDGRCDETLDGRHYSKAIVAKQLEQLHEHIRS